MNMFARFDEIPTRLFKILIKRKQNVTKWTERRMHGRENKVCGGIKILVGFRLTHSPLLGATLSSVDKVCIPLNLNEA